MSAAIARIAFFFAALTGLAAPCGAQSDGPVARPEVKAGDTWSYRRMDYWRNQPLHMYRVQVSFADGKAIHTVTSAGDKESDVSWTADWNAVSTLIGTYRPAQALLQFPLQVGGEYKAGWEITLRNGTTELHERKIKVVGWEDVVVPAGKFRALKVEAEGTFQVTHHSRSGTARHVIWYVPEVKRWVKMMYEDVIMLGGPRGPNLKTGEELVSYRLQ